MEIVREFPNRDGLPTMSMAWTILLAVVAGTGGNSSHPALDHAPPTADRVVRAHGHGPSRSLSFARKTRHRVCSGGFCALDDLEEFGTEEVDETWMVHLDAIASATCSWLFEAWSRSVSPPNDHDGIALLAASHFPLRC